jgi:signal transduction histidine kinase
LKTSCLDRARSVLDGHVQERDMHKFATRFGPIEWVLIAFGFVAAAFIISFVIVEGAEMGIRSAAEAIVTNAAPSMHHLAGARAEVRHQSVLLDDYLDAMAAGGSDPEGAARRGIAMSRIRLEREWTAYRGLPVFPGELEIREPAARMLGRFNGEVDRALAEVDAGRPNNAEQILNQEIKPDSDVLYDLLERVATFNSEAQTRLAQTIETHRNNGLLAAGVLAAACLLLALGIGRVSIRLLRKHEQNLADQARELDAFSGRVAHDIKGPLATVLLDVQALESRHRFDERASVSLARMWRGLNRMNSIVDELLEFARAAARPPLGATVELLDVVADVVEGCAPEAAARRVSVSVLPSPPVAVACGAGVLTVLLSNLLSNALKHLGDAAERRVTIAAHIEPSAVRITVTDTGLGVAEELRDHIFEPMVRGTTQEPGLGLGLATVKRLAEAHGGGVGLAETTGTGSTFWLELPRALPRAATPPRGARLNAARRLLG